MPANPHIASLGAVQAVPTRAKPQHHFRVPGSVIGLGVLLLVVVWASVGIGAVSIRPLQVAAILLKQIGIETPWAFETQQEMVLLVIRLPRVLLGLLVGAGLSVSGATMQGLFRNPLADPGLVGVSSGAALAAVLVIVFGGTLLGSVAALLGPFVISVASFLGSVVATLMVYRLATSQGKTSVATMLLAGIALNALAGAGTGLMTLIADDAQLRDITFWTLGSLGGATWPTLGAVAPFMAIGILSAPLLARPLNAIQLGEAEAGHLGIDVEWIKQGVVLITALMVGAAVAVSGIIGFLGLVVPHLLRLMLGPDHRVLLPGSALLGASLLLGADLLARTIIAPAELPIGIVTAFIGAPFFLWLLLRNRNQSGMAF